MDDADRLNKEMAIIVLPGKGGEYLPTMLVNKRELNNLLKNEKFFYGNSVKDQDLKGIYVGKKVFKVYLKRGD